MDQRKVKRSNLCSVRFDDETFSALSGYAAEKDWSISHAARHIIERFLAQRSVSYEDWVKGCRARAAAPEVAE